MRANITNLWTASFVVIAVLTATQSLAKELSFSLVNETGDPVAMAVVTWEGSNQLEKKVGSSKAIMDQKAKAFQPYILAVSAGTEIDFPNSDSIHHHVYSFSPAKTFEIEMYAGTLSAPIIFDNPGLVVLGCNIHDVMVGYIHVSADSNFTQSDVQGLVTIDVDTESPFDITIWHPDSPLPNGSLKIGSEQIEKQGGTLTFQVANTANIRNLSTPLQRRFEELRKARSEGG